MRMVVYRGVRYREEDAPIEAKRPAIKPEGIKAEETDAKGEKQAPEPEVKARRPANK